MHSDETPDEATQRNVRRRAPALMPVAAEAIDAAFKKIADVRRAYGWAPPVHTRIMRGVRGLPH